MPAATPPYVLPNRIDANIALNALKIEAHAALAIQKYVDGIVDNFIDETGIDTINSVAQYYDAANDWYISNTAGSDGTGGTITHAGGKTIHTFTSTGAGTFVAPAAAVNVRILMVGGGGGGGGSGGGTGGGGAGEMYDTTTATVALTAGESCALSVGAGGTAGAADGSAGGGQGSDTTFKALTVKGGGGGGSGVGEKQPTAGGSGGGQPYADPAVAGGASTKTIGLGNVGGGAAQTTASPYPSNGGGGAGAAGNSGAAGQSGNGGAGVASDISGSSLYYAGGGGGGRRSAIGGTTGAGGSSVGGAGAVTGAGNDGVANRGSGGGGAATAGGAGGAGSAGVVVVSYTAPFLPMTLISQAFAAVAQPSTIKGLVLEHDTGDVTLNTDLKFYASRDGGTTWTQGTLANIGAYDATYNVLEAVADVSGQPAGTSLKYKLTTTQKTITIKGMGVIWA